MHIDDHAVQGTQTRYGLIILSLEFVGILTVDCPGILGIPGPKGPVLKNLFTVFAQLKSNGLVVVVGPL